MVVPNFLFDALFFGLLLLAALLDSFFPALHGAASLLIIGGVTYWGAVEISDTLLRWAGWTQESLISSIALCSGGFLYFWWSNRSDLALLVLSIGLMMAALMIAIAIISALSAFMREGRLTALGGLGASILGAMAFGALAGVAAVILGEPTHTVSLTFKLALLLAALVVWKLREATLPPAANPYFHHLEKQRSAGIETPMQTTRWQPFPRRGTAFDRLIPLLVLAVVLLVVLNQKVVNGGVAPIKSPIAVAAATTKSHAMNSVVILGSTGSIGTQALQVAQALPGEIRVLGLTAGSNAALLGQQIELWHPEVAVLACEAAYKEVKSSARLGSTRLLCGDEGLQEAATWPGADMVLTAMMGAAGLLPTLAAIESGKDVAIANKETLVAAGELVVGAAKRKGVALWPVDSEHSALAQCLLGETGASVARLTITASGGPFLEKSREEIAASPAAQALKHPTWTMGQKISIDSATLMNKGLEMIEAHWLFDVPMDSIDIVVHRQSIVHSLVTFVDGSVKAQLGCPDMRLPIQWALLRGNRLVPGAPNLDLAAMASLTFASPDTQRFPALGLARAAMRSGGTAPAALNASNEVAVGAYLAGHTGFYGISGAVEHVLERHENATRPSLDEIVAADAVSRFRASQFLKLA